MSRRTRHHINPFKHLTELTSDDWAGKHASHRGPVCVDLGCGKGDFLNELSLANPASFHVGIEIRNRIGEQFLNNCSDVPNLVLLVGNVNVSLVKMFQEHRIQTVFINFPDPYSKKKRHKKRRMVTGQLVSDLCDIMEEGGKIFVQTDDESLFHDMHDLLAARFGCLTDPADADRQPNIMGAKSGWEVECIRKGASIFRAIYGKTPTNRDNACTEGTEESQNS